MRKTTVLFLLLLILSLFVNAQTPRRADEERNLAPTVDLLDQMLAEIDAYANRVMTDWKQPGMAIGIVKNDKVVFLKGYGVKSIGKIEYPIPVKPNKSLEEAYTNLFNAVKSGNTAAIRAEMTTDTHKFAENVALQQKQPIEFIYQNGFTGTTFSPTLPNMRAPKVKGNFGALEVYNEKAQNWEDLPFVYENEGWRLAIGELFAGTYEKPGKGPAQIESEKNTPKPKKIKRSTGKAPAVRTEYVTKIPVEPAKPESPLVDENTLFAIASNSKAFTAAALAILVDEKKIAWNDKVVKYLPEFQMSDPWITSEITIRDLISHRSGLATFSGDLLWYETTYKPEEILRRTRYLKPVSSFRSAYGYQNLMFIAAGEVIAKVSGKTWGQFVKERILTPLGMTRTTTTIRDLYDNAAMPHNESGGKLRVLHRGNVDGADAAAGLNSSVADLTKWIRLQLGRGKFEGKQIFSEQQSWTMWQPNIMIPISEAASKNNPTRHFNSYGMGWFLFDYQGRKVLNHSGGLDGMLSYTVLIPEENTGFVVLTNSESPAFGIMMSKMLDVFTNAPKRDWNAEALERDKKGKIDDAEQIRKEDAARVPDTKPTLAPSAYAGTYSSQMYGDVTIEENDGKLIMKMIPAPNFVADLEHWNFDSFRIRWRPSVPYNFPRGWVTFTIDQTGKTDQLKINQPNNDFWFYELDLKRSK